MVFGHLMFVVVSRALPGNARLKLEYSPKISVNFQRYSKNAVATYLINNVLINGECYVFSTRRDRATVGNIDGTTDSNFYSQFSSRVTSARRKLARAIIFLAGKLKSHAQPSCAKMQREEKSTRREFLFRLTSSDDV